MVSPSRLKRPLLYVMSVLYVVAGVMHFVIPGFYVQIVPPFLPFPLALVYLSGTAEIVLGVGLLSERTRRLAAWGIVALLFAVFPANVYMAMSGVVIEGVPEAIADPSGAARWGRLPLQAVLVAWAWWYTRPTTEASPDEPSR
ncbi:MAG: DoxX family protein [Halobacteriales archaeon]|nr:DoxX family protein [Halobacteriales archaeon]